MASFFLARTQEQSEFRRVLQSLVSPSRNEGDAPFIFLFYGEGGMGKTSLLHRLRDIVKQDQPFERDFELLYLDWEQKYDMVPDLRVGHDNLRAETILAVLHDHIIKEFRGAQFKQYDRILLQINEAERILDNVIKSNPENSAYSILRQYGPKGIAFLIRGGISIFTPNPLEVFGNIPQEPLEKGAQFVLDAGEQKIAEARRLVKQILTPDLYAVTRNRMDIWQRHSDMASRKSRGANPLF